MSPFKLLPQSVRHLGVSQLSYGIRVFIALCGAITMSLVTDRIDMVIPLFLGVIASALAETEDGWQGRLRALSITLVLFLVTAFGVQLLMSHPWAMGISIAVVAFSMSMGGALGRRYGQISQATLILAVYTMIGLNQATQAVPVWYEPALLTLGALWYGVLSVIWAALFVHIPLRQALATLYVEVGRYLKLKSRLFPLITSEAVDSLRLDLAQQHGQVVVALNKVRAILVSRIDSSPQNPRLGRYIQLYFIAQAIHERASSSHYDYADLAETFFHSDILFRIQRQLYEAGVSCEKIGEAVRSKQAIDLHDSEIAVAGLKKSMAYLAQNAVPVRGRLFRSLRQLSDNVVSLQQELDKARSLEDISLTDASQQIPQPPVNFRAILSQIVDQLTPKSQVFRHAVRMSIGLTCGYAIIQTTDISVGYWVMLTTLFVCLPTFGSTRKRLYERIVGTVVGLVLAWSLITLFPLDLIQLLIAVVAGVVFFLTRTHRYVLATSAITLMVICCFNQVSDGYDVILPRLFDTLIGSVISWLAVFFILPDWSYRQLPITFAEGLRRSSDYLRDLMGFYQAQAVSEQVYRHSRRRANNADALLTSTLVNMQQEPGHFRRDTELWQRLVIRSHTLFNYIAAFGAHREALIAQTSDPLLIAAGEYIVNSLTEVAQCLEDRSLVVDCTTEFEQLRAQLDECSTQENEQHYFVLSQLLSLLGQLEDIRKLTRELQIQVHGEAVTSKE
ncbi:YccS family putative transporter [Alteromonas sp. C1M14]|uniref:YccS family putative transporter n=1 Tax=Alteromonas sp. C1M14 TaxID=2841567 RepID=UPI001C09CBD1|nr:YccS family putative transporter [Alteromonas sp. C1M14]MBU2979314.1 TIGR01666 family membrane protein [Alteromonas sp. C1M14]